MTKLITINSGSSGNCFIITKNDKHYMIDAGVTLTNVKKRYKQVTGEDFSPVDLKAIFITHLHSDHIKGLIPIFNQSQCKIYSAKWDEKTLAQHEKKKSGFTNNIDFDTVFNRELIKIDGITFTPVSSLHDTIDSVSYSVESDDGEISLHYITDSQAYPEYMVSKFEDKDHIFLEANYSDDYMTCTDVYDPFLKDRIQDEAHASNEQAINAIEMITSHNPNLKTVSLGHISTRCNAKEVVEKYVYSLQTRFPNITFRCIEENCPAVIWEV
jgi:phosphoribosyl 1,2-cyclic phosphodiesterase